MFDIGSSELLLIIIVAVVVIGPKDLPRVLYKLGQVIGKGRAMTRHFRSGIDEMIRQAEMEEMEKKWAADNARIMAQAPSADPATDPVAVLTDAPTAAPTVGTATGTSDIHSGAEQVDDGYQPFIAQSAPQTPDVARDAGPASTADDKFENRPEDKGTAA
ncbi:MAG: Sec-independent protein translocase protein TatB [Sphingobium sp.]